MNNTVHILKTWHEFFQASLDGHKNFEVRKNDRGFKVGDILILREYFPDPEFSGHISDRCIARTITYIFRGPLFGVEEGYVVLGVK